MGKFSGHFIFKVKQGPVDFTRRGNIIFPRCLYSDFFKSIRETMHAFQSCMLACGFKIMRY